MYESDILRADADDHLLLACSPHAPLLWDFQGKALATHQIAVFLLHDLGSEQIHGRIADKTGDERCRRLLVQLIGRRVSLQLPLLHDGNAVGHGHGFHLIMGDINGGDPQVQLQTLDLTPHGQAQPSVQIGEGFIKEE